MQMEITIKDRQLADDHKTLFLHDPEDNFYLCKSKPLFDLLQVGKVVQLNGESKTSQSGNPYFLIAGVGGEEKPPSTEQHEPLPQIKEPSRNRSFALAYSEQLAVADKIPVDKILSYAEVFVRWLDGDIQVKDEEVFGSLLKKTFGVT